MRVEVVSPEADEDRGGFGARVHMLVLMTSQFAHVRCLLTDWPRHPVLRGVRYVYSPVPHEAPSRLRLRANVYPTRPPRRPAWPRPDVLLVESLDLLAARRNVPDVPVVFDEHNLYWNLLRHEMARRPPSARGASGRPAAPVTLSPAVLRRAMRFEEKAIGQVNAVLVTSPGDRNKIVSRFPDATGKVHVIPNGVNTTWYKPTPPEAETSSTLFAGDFSDVPNLAAASIIGGNLAPKLPLIPFMLAGRNLPTYLSLPRNVVVLGHVDDLRPVLAKAGVCIAPLVHGSGTRIKILTYLAAGKAVVATTKACEGLDVVNEEHLLIRDDWNGFVAAVRRLLGDPVWRLDLGRAGRKLVEQKYDWRLQVPRLRNILEGVAAQA